MASSSYPTEKILSSKINSSTDGNSPCYFQVVIVTLAFAICWLPIHTLELMMCSQSSLLHSLIRSYPKVLYAIRALTHALAYFNSCLNPYLYALLNRNFCFDLIDIIPCCFVCAKTKEIHKKKNSNLNTNLASLFDDQPVSQARPNEDNDDDEEDDDEEDKLLHFSKLKSTNVDASCQVELLRLSANWFNLDFVSLVLFLYWTVNRTSFSRVSINCSNFTLAEKYRCYRESSRWQSWCHSPGQVISIHW